MLFQFAVLKRPTDKEAEQGKRTEIVLPPSEWFVATSSEEANLIACSKIPPDQLQFADRLEVAVRPF